MAHSQEFVRYVADQMSDAGRVTYRLMFGAYGLYLDGVMIGIVGDGEVYIKVTEEGREIVPNAPLLPPYPGAKNYFFVEDLDDRDLLTALARATFGALARASNRKE